jgi:glycosyltransferase involved in cell wall biosynthesis
LALPIAAAAASQLKARLGFDCEDLLGAGTSDPEEIIELIERTYVPACDYVSAASQGMADELARRYGFARPIVLYNAFPLAIAYGMTPPAQRRINTILRLHWFGQTIGAGRGIEDAIHAAGMLGGRAELYLRGRIDIDTQRRLERLAGESGLRSRLLFLPLIDHAELVRSLEQFDVGLALERPENRNSSVTASNKVFSYMLAGLAVAATETRGQREVLSTAPSVGFMYPAGDAKALAEALTKWIDDRQKLRAAQQAAWDTARARFCWDYEKIKLFQALESGSTVATVAG